MPALFAQWPPHVLDAAGVAPGELEDLGEDDIPDYESTIEILTRRFHLLDKSLPSPEASPNLTRLTEVALEYLTSKDAPGILPASSGIGR